MVVGKLHPLVLVLLATRVVASIVCTDVSGYEPGVTPPSLVPI